MSYGNEESNDSDSVLLNTFHIKKKRCRVYLHKNNLTWESDEYPYSQETISLSNVISVQYTLPNQKCDDENKKKEKNLKSKKIFTNKLNDSKSTNYNGLIIHYVERAKKNKWKINALEMIHNDPRQVASWVKTLRNCLKAFSARPKNVILFINPFGGKKQGIKIYEHFVKPLFDLARINSTVFITQYSGHTTDILYTCSLDNVDAIVCIGGDGTFSEVFNGLVVRTAKDAEIDYNDCEVVLPTPSIPVGVVPGGSTDTMAYCFHGTSDIETAVLLIILGNTRGLDLCSIHSDEGLLRFYSSVISYGFLGDVARDSEKFRWMGPKRYEYSGFKKFMLNKGYLGEVNLIEDDSEPNQRESSRCYENCLRCSEKQNLKEKRNEDDINKRWKTFKGKYLMINGANVSCACERSPNGISPFAHLGDGCLDVILIKHTSLINNLRLLLRLSTKNPTKNIFDLPFVEVHRAKQFQFRALSNNKRFMGSESSVGQLIPEISVWNCDGEIEWESNLNIRVHCQLIKVFTRGFPDKTEEQCCKFCV